ncbi:MAG: hypothetical protein K8R69_01415 [Deltaproteobacteria bacterium]|nr:hypothetical protein [Deltaproteobacteria bacterium]
MFSILKKGLSLAGVLLVVALVLNLNIGGRPARDRALEIWQSEGVQKVYGVVRDRVLAVIRKDISVEDAFKPDLDLKNTSATAKSPAGNTTPGHAEDKPSATAKSSDDNRVIHLEKLDDQDRKALEKILEKSSN